VIRNQLAKAVVNIATDAAEDQDPYEGKNPAEVDLGRLGGLKGGKARADKLSPARRSDISRKAARARWAGKGE